jgi:hypothetical protein
MQDLLAGHISLKIEQATQTLPMVRSGQVRGYAVTAMHRLAQAPGLPRSTRRAFRAFTSPPGMGCGRRMAHPPPSWQR